MLPAVISLPDNRLVLKLIKPQDWAFFRSLMGDAEIMKFIKFYQDAEKIAAYFKQLCDYSEYAKKSQINYVISQGDEPIGVVGLVINSNRTFESGTVMTKAYQGQGLANVIRKHLYSVLFFDCQARMVLSRCNTKNMAANKLNKKFGMKLEKVVEEPDNDRQMNVWSLDPETFASLV